MIKFVSGYWMGVPEYPFQGARDVRKTRYLGSIKSHCKNLGVELIVYTHQKSLQELEELKSLHNLNNLTIKILELTDMKLHERINQVREKNFDPKLDGRGSEIMWGKFDVLERESINCDQIFWIDAGLQTRDIFPWRYSTLYSDKDISHKHTYVDPSIRIPWADNPQSEFDFGKIFNDKLINKIIDITKNKIILLGTDSPQLSYSIFKENGLIPPDQMRFYPIAGLFGGRTSLMKEFINEFWVFSNKCLDLEIQTTEEAIMKLVFEKMSPEIFQQFKFRTHQWGLSIDFHFDEWKSEKDGPKPLYTVWNDILNYQL